jgi:drug/metabolite transporter (DMT)-like permease
MTGIPPISATAASVLFGLIITLPFIFVTGVHLPHSEQAILGILYIGIFPSVGSFVFWNIAVSKIGASHAGIYLNLITVFTAILSTFLGQSKTVIQVGGGLLVFLGVYLTSKKGKAAELLSSGTLKRSKVN